MKVEAIVQDLSNIPSNESMVPGTEIVDSTKVKEVSKQLNQVSEKLTALKSSFVNETQKDTLRETQKDIANNNKTYTVDTEDIL